MTLDEAALGRIIGLLDRLSIPCMVTGAIAAIYHGRPRATHDADVVIDPAPGQIDPLVDSLEANGFYVSADSARWAVRERGKFNVIETTTAAKVDLILRKARPFSVEEFGRRRRVDLPFAKGVSMVTPEDAILSKLEWARLAGDSDRQLRDAAGIVEISQAIDRRYIRQWASELGVLDLWDRIESR